MCTEKIDIERMFVMWVTLDVIYVPVCLRAHCRLLLMLSHDTLRNVARLHEESDLLINSYFLLKCNSFYIYIRENFKFTFIIFTHSRYFN